MKDKKKPSYKDNKTTSKQHFTLLLAMSLGTYHFFKLAKSGVIYLFKGLSNDPEFNERKKQQLAKKRMELAKKRQIQKEQALLKQEAYNKKRKAPKIIAREEAKRKEILDKRQKLEEEKLKKLELQKNNKKEKTENKKEFKEKVVKETPVNEITSEKEKLRAERQKLREEHRLQKLELYKRKQIDKQKAIEAKDRKKQAEQIEKIKREKERRKRLKESYKSENYHKQSFTDNLLKKINDLPKNIKKSLKAKYNNLTIVKNIKNKRDINRQALLLSFEGDDAKKSDEKLTYQYVAKSPSGKIVRDYFDAYSKVEVHSFLLSEGYEVYSIKTSSVIQILNSSVVKSKIKMKDLIFFLTQLSTYIKSGISLVDALKILSRQYKNKSYQKIFRTIIYDLTMGDSFSQALEKQSSAFPKLLINMVKAAEMTGDLAETLDDMAEYYTQTEKVRKQMFTALLYPTIILIVAIGVLSFIMIYIIPKFVEIYESMNAQIPTITAIVLSFSNFMQKYYIIVFAVFFGSIILLKFLYDNVKIIRTFLQWFAMHLPVFGNIIIYNEVTMFTKTFSSLLKHNVFITDSMEILNKITNNEIYKMLILDTITNLARGDKISDAFRDHWVFPIPAYEMIVTGEKTGQLAEMMAKVADYYQELHKNLVTRMKTFIEPVLIIVLTIVVGIIIVSIVKPMFDMYSVLQ